MRAISFASLASLAIVAACSEATAPPDQPADTLQPTGTLTAKIVVNDWFPSAPYVFEACGETLTYVGEMDHLVIDETVTPSGQSHWGFRIQTLGATITAEPSGDVYRASPFAGHGIINEDLDGNKYGWVGGATAVAKGVNTEKRLRIKESIRVMVTPDGTVIHDRFIVGECR